MQREYGDGGILTPVFYLSSLTLAVTVPPPGSIRLQNAADYSNDGEVQGYPK